MALLQLIFSSVELALRNCTASLLKATVKVAAGHGRGVPVLIGELHGLLCSAAAAA